MALLVERIEDLYNDFPENRDFFEERYHESLLSNLEKLADVRVTDNLEAMMHSDRQSSLSFAMSLIPHRVLAEEFGPDVLVWLWDQYPIDNNVHDRTEETIAKYTERDMAIVKKYHHANWRIFLERNTPLLLRAYDIHQALPQILAEAEREIIPQFIRSKKRIGKYHLEQLDADAEGGRFRMQEIDGKIKEFGSCLEKKWTSSTNGDVVYVIASDTPLGMVLTYDEKPIAYTSFYPLYEDELKMLTIQGIRPHVRNTATNVYEPQISPGLDGSIAFREAFIAITEDIARRMQYPYVVIRGAKNNPWTLLDTKGNVHLPLERGKQIYNELPQILGYTPLPNGDSRKQIITH